MRIAVIDYGSGNLRSAAKALERAAALSGIETAVTVTADPDLAASADGIVLPGVGAFAACRRGLGLVPGMEEALHEAVFRRARPFLGICVGMQLLASEGHEHGISAGLDWIAGSVEPIDPGPDGLKIPHMGWNVLDFAADHPLLTGLVPGVHAYFVHSYQFRPRAAETILATTPYGAPIVAMLARGNIAGTQFHPEKSQAAGLHLLANFLAWRP